MLVNNVETSYSYVLLHHALRDDNITKGLNVSIGEYKLHYSHDLDITITDNNNHQIIALGYLLDIRNGDLTSKDILKSLSISKNIDRELDYINGRYVLIVNKAGIITIYTDASALLPINYSAEKSIIASHDVLIKELLNSNDVIVKTLQEELKGSFDFARYQNIFKFNPSLKLNLNSGEFTRYYPDKDLVPKSIDFITKELEIYFAEMVKWLKNWNKEIILTLTGGYDSRVSMALTNSFSEKVEYITYLHPNLARLSERAQEIYDIDMFITKNIGTNLNVNHTMVDLSKYNLKDEERKNALKTLQTAHSFSLIDYFRNERKFNKALHIKSTVYGMGKSDFPLNKNHNPQTLEEMAEFIHGVSKEAMKLPDYENIVDSYYKRNLHVENVGKGRHYFEIFHLESRMGNWHSNVTQETDPELLDFIFVNTRRIIDLIQSPSMQERKDKVLYKNLINKYWPALLFVGFNEKTFNIDYDKIGLNTKYINGLKVFGLNNLHMDIKDENAITIKPNKEIVGPQYQYVFKAKNNTHTTKQLKFKSFFNKENGRKYINVKIMKLSEKTYKSIDVVDLYDGYDLTLEPFEEFMIRIDYMNVFDKASWQQAGRIQISNI